MKNIKIQLLLGLVIIIISSFLVFSFQDKGEPTKEEITQTAVKTVVKTKSTPPAMEQKTGVQTPVKIMGLSIPFTDPTIDHPVIESGFGLNRNEKFDLKRAINTLKLSDGSSIYEIEPIVPHSGNGTFYITTNTEDQKVESIIAINTFSSLAEAEREAAKIGNIASQKYHLAHNEKNLQYYKDERGNLMIIMIKKIKEAYEVRLDCLCFR
jgi:hypothetical protein